MNFDQLRALAGIPMANSADGRKAVVEATKFAPVKADGHFDITVPESQVGKIAVALAKEGLPVDVTYDGMENFFFNFKSSELKDKAAKIANVKPVKEDAKYIARKNYDLNDGTWYVDKPDGSMHTKGIQEFEAKALAKKLNDGIKEAIQYKDLSDAQLRGLQYAIGDLLTAEGIEHSGLEVTHVQDEGDALKAIYVYENKTGKDTTSTILFKAKFTDNGVEDFKEIK